MKIKMHALYDHFPDLIIDKGFVTKKDKKG